MYLTLGGVLFARFSLKYCAQAANMPRRSDKQIRERWLNHLDANIKRDEWTPDQDTLLIEVLPRPTHNALLHLALERSVRGLEFTQHSVHSKS